MTKLFYSTVIGTLAATPAFAASSHGAAGAGLIGLIVIIVFIAFYFLPSIIAWRRGHRQTLAIFLLNLFAGWTFLGWLGALIWSAIN